MSDNLKSVITCDLDGKIETFSEGAEQLFGYTQDEIIGKGRVSDFSSGQIVLGHVVNWLAESVDKGKWEGETVFLHKDGHEMPCKIKITPTKDKNGEDPDIDLALYQYGNDNLSIRNGYIQRVQSFTGELDEISEKLFALKTNGGEEYCGQVINTSLNDLNWSSSSDDLQMIYIAGNEGFNQGAYYYERACEIAKSKNVTVNTIFCGNRYEGINTFWKHGADLTNGNFACIDSDAKSVHYDSPYDDQISLLNVELNKTYVPCNAEGISKKEKQLMQDFNAEKIGKANASRRYLSKGSKVYRNSSWDLVDYSKGKRFDISKVDKKYLPDSLKNLSDTDLQNKINELSSNRNRIKREMATLNKKREDFVLKEKQKAAKVDDIQLENAIIKGLREQASKKKIRFEETIN